MRAELVDIDLIRALSKDRKDRKVAIIEEGKYGFELHLLPTRIGCVIKFFQQIKWGSPKKLCERRARTVLISRVFVFHFQIERLSFNFATSPGDYAENVAPYLAFATPRLRVLGSFRTEGAHWPRGSIADQ